MEVELLQLILQDLVQLQKDKMEQLILAVEEVVQLMVIILLVVLVEVQE